MKTPFALRRRILQSQLGAAHLSALLITRPASWYYLTGFSGEAGALVVSRSGAVIVTDGRFTAQARQETSGVRITKQPGALAVSVGQLVRSMGLARVGFDASHITVSTLAALRRASGKRARWIAAAGHVEGLRGRKDAAELARMRKAAALADRVMGHALKILKPGVRELEIAAEIEFQMRQLGASGPAFETIVASGERSAYPHAQATAKRLRKNELVVLDLGVILAHYCSDITRTVVVGRASQKIRKWHQAVQAAQRAAIEAVKAGATCGAVDAAARGVLAGQDLDQYFVHSTGHGLGLEVHEDPRVAKGQKQILEPGNVVTIEPGVYVPGIGGVRIEDDVAVHEGSTEVLTRTPRDLIEI
jgi:Xaa-Pro aminopeptidase